jgi:heme/copper-type cytochrome/quinol oxidase subunit 2
VGLDLQHQQQQECNHHLRRQQQQQEQGVGCPHGGDLTVMMTMIFMVVGVVFLWTLMMMMTMRCG